MIVFAFLLVIFFGLPFSKNDGGSGIVLPQDGVDGVDIDLDKYTSNREMVEAVRVDGDNIKKIVAALRRPAQYHISANSTIYYTGGQSSKAAEVYFSDGVSRTIVYDGSGQQERSCIINGDNVYIWEGVRGSVYSGSLGSFSADDYAFIPTYEDILELDDGDIISADYLLYNEMYCLVAETRDRLSGYRGLYYISAESGLLIGAQRFDGDTLVYSLSCSVLDAPITEENIFTLPDGTYVG